MRFYDGTGISCGNESRIHGNRENRIHCVLGFTTLEKPCFRENGLIPVVKLAMESANRKELRAGVLC